MLARVHPLVLLFAVDHYNRDAAQDLHGRACGILLGNYVGQSIDIANAFAVPFEENLDSGTFTFDAQYIQTMIDMYRKLKKSWLVGILHFLAVRRYCKNPLFLVVDVNPKGEFPASAYVSDVEEKEDGTVLLETFKHVQSEMGAQEV
ncbi:MAG: putative 26S proteasome nonATPase regulatory subunit 7 putat [Streblomastix strix]|uniref:Putative 26S proteasome nonATPase regulatory subunit 7 putat n=1 Tax=Streblomastix strix TaxID=222440 RepID=A0A5J4VNI4_9EUKA|nr:MAG: putative 26S proteasome nonATPase regulatory subunit 7 putat [Streblomastix strix]